jgi:CheY-like chemotaxis protein
VTEKDSGRFTDRLSGTLEQLGLGEAFGELRTELVSLGRELAVAGLAAASEVRSAAEPSATPQPSTQNSSTSGKPAREAEPKTEPMTEPVKGRRSLRPRGQGARSAASPSSDPSLEREQWEEREQRQRAANEAVQASVATLGQSLGRLSGQLDHVCGLIDAVAGLVEEQTERLETVEELLERVDQLESHGGPVGRPASAQADSPETEPEPSGSRDFGVLLVDPDGVRAAFLAGSLGASGLKAQIATDVPDALNRIAAGGRSVLAVHADADPMLARVCLDACRQDAAVGTSSAESNVERALLVYYTLDDAGSDTVAKATQLCEELGVVETVACGPDASALVEALRAAAAS